MIKGCGINNFPPQCPALLKSKAHGIMFEEELVTENPDDSSCVSILETPKRPKRNRKRTRSGQSTSGITILADKLEGVVPSAIALT